MRPVNTELVPPTPAAPVSITIPPQLERVTEVRDFLDSAGLEHLLSRERVFDLKVAVSEAVANAIEHAGSPATVCVTVSNDRVVVDVTNEGAFPCGRTAHTPKGTERGLGLRLMISLADELAFSGSRHGMTDVRLTFLAEEKPAMISSAANL
jgi:anti-sigma regulatory factor (Ser/Thr protein kinase)